MLITTEKKRIINYSNFLRPIMYSWFFGFLYVCAPLLNCSNRPNDYICLNYECVYIFVIFFFSISFSLSYSFYVRFSFCSFLLTLTLSFSLFIPSVFVVCSFIRIHWIDVILPHIFSLSISYTYTDNHDNSQMF